MCEKISQLRGHYVIDLAVITELIFVNYVQAYRIFFANVSGFSSFFFRFAKAL